MQNKGTIRFVAIALVLVCLYQLFFTVVTSREEKKAEAFATEADGNFNLVKYNNYLDALSSTPVYNFLFLKEFTYRECKEREINLGLDLKGGMNVILEVSVVDVIKSLSNYNTDPTFLQAIEAAKAAQKAEGGQTNFVTLFGQCFEKIDPNASLAAIFNTTVLKDKVNFNSTNAEVLNVLRDETEAAIANSFQILRTRIDRFGVAQPNIQRLGNTGRILVELPGIKDSERVRKLLQGTANLEFWETYDNTEVQQYLIEANAKIKEINDLKEAESGSVAVAEQPEESKAESAESNSLIDKLAADSTATEDVTSADEIAKNYPLFAVLNPMYSQDGRPRQGAAVGYAHFKDTAAVNAMLNEPLVKALFPRNLKLLWGVKSFDDAGNYFELIAIKVTSRDGQPALSGDVVTDASDEYAQGRGVSEVSMSMNAEGARKWARITKENIGKSVAIVLDNYVYSYPTVQTEIKGGRSSITGNFTVAEAKDLANILKSGKMPAPARIEQETIVGPSLGQESINKGFISFVIAFVLVLVYMLIYYRTGGMAANIALLLNVFFIFGVLASFGAVLTLSGIAGIVLTLGMAVDSNVLIYERIKEELAAGKGIKLAVKDGYANAYSAILDSNITTLLTAIVLGKFGEGPIHGFAVTLSIGILASLFTSIFITRLIFERMLDKERNLSFASKATAQAFKGINFDFIGARKVCYVISSVVLFAGIISLCTRGLDFGVDFTGGRTYVVRFDKPVSTVEIQNAIAEKIGQTAEVKTYGGNEQVKITTKYLFAAGEEATEADYAEAAQYTAEQPSVDDVVEVKFYLALKDKFLPAGTTFSDFKNDYRMSSEKVGATIAEDIKSSAALAITFSLIVIFLYIAFRFRKWQFGLGSLVALVHDTLFVFSMYSLLYSIMPFSMSIDQSFIAAILTVVGYSINDTVVVFDRIREYMGLQSKRSLQEVMNGAVNSTLARTINTSVTTLLVLITIFIFGGEVIRGFIFAMMIGIAVGTYSSLFVATPITFDLLNRQAKKAEEAK
ncbi:MAG: protein translocase subunit SecDF [Salinivirgaceae bacterium]|nr:protein translocase subunit SecDF [Salinivirgaceae bacterium]